MHERKQFGTHEDVQDRAGDPKTGLPSDPHKRGRPRAAKERTKSARWLRKGDRHDEHEGVVQLVVELQEDRWLRKGDRHKGHEGGVQPVVVLQEEQAAHKP